MHFRYLTTMYLERSWLESETDGNVDLEGNYLVYTRYLRVQCDSDVIRRIVGSLHLCIFKTVGRSQGTCFIQVTFGSEVFTVFLRLFAAFLIFNNVAS